jgi:lysophospholipase L1-like esterase
MTVGARFLSRLVIMLVALVGLVMAGALPAVAESNPNTIEYVALGDSYAAGQGGGSYLNTCLESPNGYPYVLDPKRRIDLQTNAACTGATTSNVISNQLSALDEDTALVTLTVGAADLHLSDVLTACTAVPPTGCQAAINSALLLLAAPPGGQSVLGVRLTSLYEMVAAAAPNALIVVTGYPYLFDQPANCAPLPSTPSPSDIMGRINCATAALNSTIQQAVAAQDSEINIVYVDVTDEFAGHGIGSEEPFINSESDPIGAYHPNAAGYRAYAKAIFAAVRSASLDDKNQAA